MRYFLVNGYGSSHTQWTIGQHSSNASLASPTELSRKEITKHYKKNGVELLPLGEKVFLTVPRYGRISLFVHEADRAYILVRATSQRNAYLLANTFRAVTTCFQGLSPVDNYDAYLLELASAPCQVCPAGTWLNP